MRPVKPWHLIAAYVLGAMTFGTPPTLPIGWPDVGSWFVIGGAPPAKVSKLTVVAVEDDSPAARIALVGEQDDILRSLLPAGVRKSVEAAGGEFQVISKTNTATLDSANAAALFAVADKTHVPSIVAATPSRGVAPQALPVTVDATKKLLAPLGVK